MYWGVRWAQRSLIIITVLSSPLLSDCNNVAMMLRCSAKGGFQTWGWCHEKSQPHRASGCSVTAAIEQKGHAFIECVTRCDVERGPRFLRCNRMEEDAQYISDVGPSGDRAGVF